MSIVQFFVDAIRMGAIFLFGCTGETLTEKTGHLNLGTPGIMCIGAYGGCLGVYIYMSSLPEGAAPVGVLLVLTAILFCALFAGLAGLIYSFLTISLKANQNVTGLALTTFGIGFMKFFGAKIHNDDTLKLFKDASVHFKTLFPFYDKLGWFGEIFLSHGVLIYLAIILALVSSFMLSKTRMGLHLRAVGENPAAADAMGINVDKYKYGYN